MMEAVYVMGAVNLLLCAWIVHLQQELKITRLTIEVSHELIRQIAMGEVDIRRNGNEVRIVTKEKANETT